MEKQAEKQTEKQREKKTQTTARKTTMETMKTPTKTTTQWVMLLQIRHPLKKKKKKDKTGLVERETFPSRNGEITWSERAYGREEGRCSSSSSAAAQSMVPPGPTMHAMSCAGD